jgi:pyrroloquinoline quinone (PQQ) biosynthesis protein C
MNAISIRSGGHPSQRLFDNLRALRLPWFQLASAWAVNMVVGSYCFPCYVAALAARAEDDAVRHGLLENAWDESGGYAHAGTKGT